MAEARPPAPDRAAGAEPATRDTATEPDADIYVVPRAPGPLRRLNTGSRRGPDDLDELIDEMFGSATDERPGWFDAVLLVGGIALLAWALDVRASGVVVAIAIGAMILGIALPARGLLQAIGRRELHMRRRRVVGTGYTLDASNPTTAALLHAYDDCLQAAGLPGVASADEVVATSHLAVVEAASLLDGGGPVATAQIDYVAKRTDAIRELTEQLLTAHRRWLDAQSRVAEEATSDRRLRAAAVTQAREELEATGDVGALDELRSLTERLREDDGRGAG